MCSLAVFHGVATLTGISCKKIEVFRRKADVLGKALGVQTVSLITCNFLAYNLLFRTRPIVCSIMSS